MRVETTTRTLYKFDELDESAQQHAVESLYDINVDHDDWHEHVINDAKRVGALLGIEIKRIYYSGFSSQGDGACFEGDYAYRKGATAGIREYAPADNELHRIADELQTLQRRNFYGLSANVCHRGHYYHAYCTHIDVDNYDRACSVNDADILRELLRDYMQWIYRSLEHEYEYLTSRDLIVSTIEANEYEFTENGELA